MATDEDVTLAAYNTPLGKIAILKYDYINTDQKPVGATFTATNDENDGLTYNGTLRTAQGTDEQALEGGYTLSGDHYVKDGVSYTIAYLTNVVPGTYTVVENTKPNGYLYTPKSDPGDPWHTTQTVRSQTTAAPPWWSLPTCPTRRTSPSTSTSPPNTSARATCSARNTRPSSSPSATSPPAPSCRWRPRYSRTRPSPSPTRTATPWKASSGTWRA